MYVAFDAEGNTVGFWNDPLDAPPELTLIDLPEEIKVNDSRRCKAAKDEAGNIVGVDILPLPYTYRELRKAEYPPLVDLADALVHQYMGDPVPLENYYKACIAVKQKYPKPKP